MPPHTYGRHFYLCGELGGVDTECEEISNVYTNEIYDSSRVDQRDMSSRDVQMTRVIVTFTRATFA